MILLNKVDLVSQEQVKIIEGHIKRVNPNAIVHRTVKGQIDLKHIMGIQAYAMRAMQSSGPSSDDSTDASHEHSHDDGNACNHTHEHEHDTAPPHHYEIRGITSLQVSCPTLTEEGLQALDEWIRQVLWESKLPGETSHDGPLTVLRCKGMFPVQSGQVHVLQGVRNLYEIAPAEASGEEIGVPDEGKLVLIGKGLDDVVRQSLVTLLDRYSAR